MRLPLPLDGPPVTLPPLVDAAADRWIALPPRARLLLGVLLALALLAVASRSATSAQWGEAVEVVVASETVPAGTDVTGGQLALRPWPRDLLPDGYLEALPEGRATTTLPAGTVVTSSHVAEGGIAATVAAGRVAVPIARDLVPELPIGTRLDVVASDVGGVARQLAAGARLLGVDDAYAWLEVERDQASEVAAAAARSSLAVAVLGP